MIETIDFSLNGRPVSILTDTDRMLLWVLRTDMGLTGTKYGCGQELCGACTVLVGNEAVYSCQTPVKDIRGKEVITIEGLANGGNLHPLQEAFVEHDALQCGFCTPGMILKACSLIHTVAGDALCPDLKASLSRSQANKRGYVRHRTDERCPGGSRW